MLLVALLVAMAVVAVNPPLLVVVLLPMLVPVAADPFPPMADVAVEMVTAAIGAVAIGRLQLQKQLQLLQLFFQLPVWLLLLMLSPFLVNRHHSLRRRRRRQGGGVLVRGSMGSNGAWYGDTCGRQEGCITYCSSPCRLNLQYRCAQ
jgi:hypothetical protein